MQVIRDTASTAQIANSEIRRLVEQRIYDLGKEPFDLATLGYFLVVEPGDSLYTINAKLGFPILANRWTGLHFGQVAALGERGRKAIETGVARLINRAW